jgi:hypothetical protein
MLIQNEFLKCQHLEKLPVFEALERPIRGPLPAIRKAVAR